MKYFILSLFIFSLGFSPALACSPAPQEPGWTKEKALQDLVSEDFTFVGLVEVVEAENNDNFYKNRPQDAIMPVRQYTMRVLEQYEGAQVDSLKTYTQAGNSCGIFVKEGQQKLLFLKVPLDGDIQIDEFSIYRMGLSFEDIQDHYKNYGSVRPQPLVKEEKLMDWCDFE